MAQHCDRCGKKLHFGGHTKEDKAACAAMARENDTHEDLSNRITELEETVRKIIFNQNIDRRR